MRLLDNLSKYTALTVAVSASLVAQSINVTQAGVGIGTTTPAIKTEIANEGSPYNLYLSGEAPSLYFGPTSGVFPNGPGNTAAGFIGFSTFTGSYGQGAGDLNIATQSRGPNNSSAINFLVPLNDTGNYTPAMRIMRNGNVGVGTDSPTSKLDVQNLTPGDGAYVYPDGQWVARILNRVDNPSQNGLIVANRWKSPSSTAFAVGSMFQFGSGFTTFFKIDGDGNTGVGTAAPAAKFHLKNGTAIIDATANNGLEYTDWPTPGLFIKRHDDFYVMRMISLGHTNDPVYITSDAVWNFALIDNVGNKTNSDANTNLWLSGPGGNFLIGASKVGVGTSSPTHKLTVNGQVKSKGFITDTSNWSDYVFAQDYKLTSLDEVEKHIQEKRHLPGVPSEAELIEKGLDLGQMSAVQMAKIEELMLHVIELNKEVRAQKARIEELESRNP